MTGPTPVGFVDFFILEASEYVDQLDAQLLASGTAVPDAEAMQRVARALRGSATMAKLPAFADLAGGMERVGRAMRDGAAQWEPALRGVLLSAIDDAKILLRNVRAWSSDDETRARTRSIELARYAPVRPQTPLGSPTMEGHDSYLATEAANIGAGLELLATRPNDRDAAVNVLRRVRALRGIASVKDHDSLADVLAAAEQAAHSLELGEPVLSSERIALLSAAATLLRSIATTIRGGQRADARSPEVARFSAALDTLQERESGAERVVPIDELFHSDGGPHIVHTAPNPPTTPADRFRLEVVSQGEHLQRLVSDARGARDELARDRVRRELRLALRALRLASESYGETEIATFVASHNDAAVQLDARALESLDEVAALLAHPESGHAPMAERLAALKRRRSSHMTPVIPSHVVPDFPSRPREVVAAAAAGLATAATQIGGVAASTLGDLLDAGIKTLGALDRAPLSAPTTVAEQPPIPIGVLMYRGRAAIERARQIRDNVRRSGGPVEQEQLGELFDLLDLALTD